MKTLYITTKNLLTVIALLIAVTVSSQESLVITMDDLTLDPNADTLVTAEYYGSDGQIVADTKIKWHTEPGYLGKVNKDNILTTNHSGEGYLIAKYKELRDSVKLVVNGTPKDDDDDDDNEVEDDDYPKVKIVPGNVRVEVGDSVELYAFYVDSSNVKIDTMTFMWSVEPMELGEFPNPENSMFFAGNIPAKGTIIAQYGDLADTVKIEIYESKWKKEKKEKENNGNKGKQMTIEPGDLTVYTGEPPIQYSASLKTNGKKHQEAEYMWSVSDTAIATIDADGLLTLKGETGMTLVSVEASNFGASVELLVLDSFTDMEVNSISIHRVLPSGKELKAKTFKEGDSYKIGGLPYPLNILNGGRLHFPFGCIDEDITIYMMIPEEYADMNDDSTQVTFSDDVITGVKFSVKPVGSDTIVEPYWFNPPVELKLVYKKELLDSLGVDPQELDVFFADNAGFVEVEPGVVATVDTSRNRIYSSIEHFSTIVVREKSTTTEIKELQPLEEDVMQIYPNPTSSSTTVQFRLAEAGDVNITVFNLFGQKVQLLAEGKFPEGLHKVLWQGTDQNGLPATSGVYFCRFIKDGNIALIKRVVLNR